MSRSSTKAEVELAWTVVNTASSSFTASDRTLIYAALGAGETCCAIESALAVAARARHPLPVELLDALTTWLDMYIGHHSEPRIRGLLQCYTQRGHVHPRRRRPS